MSNGRSGIRITSAPPARPECSAIQPAWRPITSPTLTRCSPPPHPSPLPLPPPSTPVDAGGRVAVAVDAPAHDGAGHGVQPGAVTATCQDGDSHRLEHTDQATKA